MNFRWSCRTSVIALGRLLISHASFAGETRRLTLAEAVRLVVEQNLTLKIARLKVKENEYEKDADRPDYFPTITTQSSAVHISELQTLTTPQGAFGVVLAQNTNLPPGKQTPYSSGTMIAQPLTQLLDPSGKPCCCRRYCEFARRTKEWRERGRTPGAHAVLRHSRGSDAEEGRRARNSLRQ